MTAITKHHQLPGNICLNLFDLKQVTAHFPMRISPHYLALIGKADDPLARQVIPDIRELRDLKADPDPLSEESQSPVSQIIHRYPRRVIFLVSNQCAVYCRFCMRKRRIHKEGQVTREAIREGLDHIRRNRKISEVILSGGDPFMLGDAALIEILSALHRMPHVRILRIHTRVPGTWPQRITPALARALSAFHPLYINIHFNHPDEINPMSEQACAHLVDAGIPLGSQTVLLRQINDNPETLQLLFQKLLQIRVRPYYIHQLDRVPGTSHFWVPMEKALGLIGRLRGRISGQAMPHFMIDLPGGGGKVELLPESRLSKNDNEWIMQNFEGRRFTYPLK
jgi:lysine 2,3-aminomutase